MAMKPRTGEVPAQAPLDQPLFVDDAPTEPILRAPSPFHVPVLHPGTSLEKAVDKRFLKNMSEDGDLGIPDRIPQHVLDDPDAGGAKELPDQKRAKKFSLARRGIAAVGIAAGVVGVFHAIGSSNEDFDAGDRADAGISGEAKPGQEVQSVLAPETVTLIQEFDARRSQILTEIVDRFKADGYTADDYLPYTGRTIEAASPTMSPQAIVDRMSAKEYFLTSNPNREEARTQVQLEARPGTPAYNAVENSIDHSIKVGLPSSDEEGALWDKEFSTGALVGPNGDIIVTANNAPTAVIISQSVRARTTAARVFQWEENAEGTAGDWRLVYSMPAGTMQDPTVTIEQFTVKDLQ